MIEICISVIDYLLGNSRTQTQRGNQFVWKGNDGLWRSKHTLLGWFMYVYLLPLECAVSLDYTDEIKLVVPRNNKIDNNWKRLRNTRTAVPCNKVLKRRKQSLSEMCSFVVEKAKMWKVLVVMRVNISQPNASEHDVCVCLLLREHVMTPVGLRAPKRSTFRVQLFNIGNFHGSCN